MGEMALKRPKRSKVFDHAYAIIICGMVGVSIIYTLVGSGAEQTLTNNKTTHVSNVVAYSEFNYIETPKPDNFTEEIRVTVPQWLSLTPPEITPPEIAPIQTAPIKLEEAVLIIDSGLPKISIIIDDMGVRQNMTRPFSNLPKAIDFSFLPYADGLEWQTKIMREAGHELMLHLPMEPSLKDQNPGPKALLTSHNNINLSEILNWNLSRFEGFVGINNHMGSLFTQDSQRMSLVIDSLKSRGLFFIDSRTSSQSTAYNLAKTHGLKYQGRDVFIDNILEHDAILAQLAELEELAIKNGSAIAIGHPHRETLKALHQWLGEVEGRGFEIVKVSSLLKQEAPNTLTSHAGSNVENSTVGGGQ